MDSLVSFDGKTFTCKGDWDKGSVLRLSRAYRLLHVSEDEVFIDLGNVGQMDTAGAMFILSMLKDLEKKNKKATIINENKNIAKLLNLCKDNDAPFPKTPPQPEMISEFFYKIGKGVSDSIGTLVSFFSFIGGTTKALISIFLNPLTWRFKATLFHIEKNGLNALPIIALTSLLIGVVIAFQGAVQLEKFGANIFIVEMVGISATRELAPLIVAIVIAGRSASAYTAELGVMKITEEVDAMKTLGFSPWDFLILPRVVALLVALPLLVIFADFVSVFGGMIVARSELDISYYEFVSRFKETVDIKHIIIGLAKAPFFGWIIATIGCFRGFQISSSTQSVGKYTTISVVNAIFWVIAFDALASVFLTKMDI